MGKKFVKLFAAMSALGLGLPSAAQADLAVEAHGGLMGIGAGIALELTPHINLRAGINSYDLDVDVDDDEGLDYDASFDLDNQYLMLDFYPSSGGGFHLTAGYYLNNNEIGASATVLNDNDAQIGLRDALAGTVVRSAMTFDDSLYAGLGWGNSVADGLVHFGFEFGLVFQGSPQIAVNVTCTPNLPNCLTDAGITQDDINVEIQDLEDEVSDFDTWPMFQFTVGINF